MIIGTAGHVDHGKTTLIHALTGTDCDQLAEEKRRGITIALGFARWRLPEPVSVVDVPGHERLVQTMLSGAGGIDGVLLALSGLAGVMPQTREHLAACALLGVRWGVVALTFADKVPDLDAAIRRARADLRGSLLAEAPIIPVSAVTGLGLDALREATRAALLAHPRPPSLGLARLPVDRVFSVSGAGTVVTGSLLDGRIFVGDTLSVTPSGAMARVRGLEVHGAAVEAVEAGQRVALSLSLKRDQITRGAILSAPGLVGVGAVFDAALRWCAHAPRPLSRQGGLVLHAYGAKAAVEIRADAPIQPGGEGVGRLRLSHPIPLLPGGRFVLRGDPDHTHGAVIGGGVILDTAPPKRRAPLIRARLWSAPEAAPTLLLREAGRGGL
ncbi:50S ribosome-binding GTPase, partial [Myxococcota bacterium]|nr:50S ribosome-binding GTPase [Myxococcota bacterium]